MFNELNTHIATVREDVNTNDMEFKSLKEFVGQEIKVDGFFFSEAGKYGKQVVVVGNGYLINMPKRAVEVFETIKEDSAKVKAVLEGHLKLVNLKMIEAKEGITVAYTLADC